MAEIVSSQNCISYFAEFQVLHHNLASQHSMSTYCSQLNCKKFVFEAGLCKAHFSALKSSASPDKPSTMKAASPQASAGGCAVPVLSKAVDTVPSAFDISVTSVSGLQNWLISIPDLPLRQALELLRPHCPGLSAAILTDMLESNDFEVANITVRATRHTLPRCVCVTSWSCAWVRRSRTEIGHSFVYCRRPVPLVCVVQRAFFQQGKISTYVASALLHCNQNDAFFKCCRSAPRFYCDFTLPTRKFCSVPPANCSACRISFTTGQLTGLPCICLLSGVSLSDLSQLEA